MRESEMKGKLIKTGVNSVIVREGWVGGEMGRI